MTGNTTNFQSRGFCSAARTLDSATNPYGPLRSATDEQSFSAKGGSIPDPTRWDSLLGMRRYRPLSLPDSVDVHVMAIQQEEGCRFRRHDEPYLPTSHQLCHWPGQSGFLKAKYSTSEENDSSVFVYGQTANINCSSESIAVASGPIIAVVFPLRSALPSGTICVLRVIL